MKVLPALAIACVMISPCAAKTIKTDVAGAEIVLAVPDGHCLLDGQNDRDREYIDRIQNSYADAADVLGVSADCSELADWRNGKVVRLTDFATAEVNAAAKQVDVSGQEGQLTHDWCSSVQEEADRAYAGVSHSTAGRIASVANGLAENEAPIVGALLEEDTVCYVATVHYSTDEAGAPNPLLSVAASVALKGRLIFLFRYARQPSATTATRLLKLQQGNARVHMALNNNQTRPK